ncbi:MAG TPA: PcfJ domain-containing protein [Nitrosomonas sp.]|nr:PcfJ domain-containing protein [Nitrosomonas sp.]
MKGIVMGRSTIAVKEKALQKIQAYEAALKKKRADSATIRKRAPYEVFISKHEHLLEFREYFIRDPKEWNNTSYNSSRQFVNFLRYVFCKYPVPAFLFQVFDPLVSSTVYAYKSTLQYWLITIGAGGSLRKLAKGIFTAQEAHWFLKADLPTPHEAAWWAKCKAAGWPLKHTILFIRRAAVFHFVANSLSNDFWNRTILFFTKYIHEIDGDTFGELLDYTRMQPLTFSFQGRTLGSMIRLSNEWHLHTKADGKAIGHKWIPMDVPYWKHYDKQAGVLWEVIQLTTGKELAYESKVQHHCVWGYTSLCVNNRARIFTLHSTDQRGDVRKHITIEVHPESRRVVQQRGKFNRACTPAESTVIHHWMLDNNLN